MDEMEYKTCRKCGTQYSNNTEFFPMLKGKLDTICRQCIHDYRSNYNKGRHKAEHESARAEMIWLVIKTCRVMQEERDIKNAKVRRENWLKMKEQNDRTKEGGRKSS